MARRNLITTGLLASKVKNGNCYEEYNLLPPIHNPKSPSTNQLPQLTIVKNVYECQGMKNILAKKNYTGSKDMIIDGLVYLGNQLGEYYTLVLRQFVTNLKPVTITTLNYLLIIVKARGSR